MFTLCKYHQFQHSYILSGPYRRIAMFPFWLNDLENHTCEGERGLKWVDDLETWPVCPC